MPIRRIIIAVTLLSALWLVGCHAGDHGTSNGSRPVENHGGADMQSAGASVDDSQLAASHDSPATEPHQDSTATSETKHEPAAATTNSSSALTIRDNLGVLLAAIGLIAIGLVAMVVAVGNGIVAHHRSAPPATIAPVVTSMHGSARSGGKSASPA